VIKITPDSDDDTRWIRSDEIGRAGNRGTWASACSNDGRYGVCLGTTQGADFSVAIFVPETKFAEFRKSLKSAPAHFREVFEEAIRRLPDFKARTGGFSNAGRA
jgi:hypothetical protein